MILILYSIMFLNYSSSLSTLRLHFEYLYQSHYHFLLLTELNLNSCFEQGMRLNTVHHKVLLKIVYLILETSKKILKKTVRVGQMWSFVVRCGHMGSEIQPKVAYCIFILNYYFLLNKWPFF